MTAKVREFYFPVNVYAHVSIRTYESKYVYAGVRPCRAYLRTHECKHVWIKYHTQLTRAFT